jgi:C1A family cysteine protease
MNFICQAAAYTGIYQCEVDVMFALQEKFVDHVSKYGLSYGTDEEYQFRFQQFTQTDVEIQRINAEEGNTFTAGHNKFSTFTKFEMDRLKGKKAPVAQTRVVHLDASNLTDSVDWRAKGAVNPVQDQGQCGSCWAFSSTAAMEGEHFIKTGTLLKLSEQQFVDCDPQSSGCNGGLEMWAFEYAATNPQELEGDYPYTAADGTCKATASKEVVTALSYTAVPKKSDSQLKAAIDAQPTCVSVDAGIYFQTYKGGILNAPLCGRRLDHAVTAVGYGVENGKEYYIVRNSWGPDWGEEGYIRMAAGKDGAGVCGVLLDSTRPTTD